LALPRVILSDAKDLLFTGRDKQMLPRLRLLGMTLS
jgi:hypothetical protein